MILIAGLGNTGKEYENTRHNAGFMLLDLLINILDGRAYNFALVPPKLQNILDIFPFDDYKTKSNISKPTFKGELIKYGDNLLILKPHTYMNASGQSILAVKNYYKCDNLIVLHDDIDLKLGDLRIKKGGGNGGHNGLKNIDLLCGSDYTRIRIGIDKPINKDIANFVLDKFNQNELDILQKPFTHGLLALLELINGVSIVDVNNKFNLSSKR